MHYYHPFLIQAGTWHITATMLCKNIRKILNQLGIDFPINFFLQRIDSLKGQCQSAKLFRIESCHPCIKGTLESKINFGNDPYVD